MHAQDDFFIPQQQAKELYKTAKEKRPADYPPVWFIDYHEGLGLGHNNIFMHDELYPAVK